MQVAVVLDHPLNTPDLALHPAEALEKLLLRCGVAPRSHALMLQVPPGGSMRS
jgi:hypothetical protein